MANHGVVTYGTIWKMRSIAWTPSSTLQRFRCTRAYSGSERLLSPEDVEKLWVQRQKYYGLEDSEVKPKDPMCPITDGVSDTISVTR